MDKSREKIIQNYISGYNTFDIEKMIGDFDDKIVSQRITKRRGASTKRQICFYV